MLFSLLHTAVNIASDVGHFGVNVLGVAITIGIGAVALPFIVAGGVLVVLCG